MDAFQSAYRSAPNLARWLDQTGTQTFPPCSLALKLEIFCDCLQSQRAEDVRLACLLVPEVLRHLSPADLSIEQRVTNLQGPEHKFYTIVLLYQLFRQEKFRIKFQGLRVRILDFAIQIWQEFPKPPPATIQVSLDPNNVIPSRLLDEAVWTGLLELVRVLLLPSKQSKKVLDPIGRLHAHPRNEEEILLEQKAIQCIVPGLNADLWALSKSPATEPGLARLNRVYRLFAALFFHDSSKNMHMQVFDLIRDPVLATLENASQMSAAGGSACTCISNFAGSREAQARLRSLDIFSRIRKCAQGMQRLDAKTLLRLLDAYLNAGFLLSEPFSGEEIKQLVLRVGEACTTPKELLKLGRIATTLLYKVSGEEMESLLPVYVTSCFSPLARLEIKRNSIEEEAEDSRALWPMALSGARGDALAASVFQAATLHEDVLSKWTLQYWLGDEGQSMEDYAIGIDQVCLFGMSPKYAAFCFQKEPNAIWGNLLTFVYGKLLQALKGLARDPDSPSRKMSFFLRKRFVEWTEEHEETLSDEMVEEWFLQYLDDMFSVAHSHEASDIRDILVSVANDHVPRDVQFGEAARSARIFALPAEDASIEVIAETLVKNGFVPEGKLWFHSCYGHKALNILQEFSLGTFGAKVPHMASARSSFYVYENMGYAIDHSGGIHPLSGQAIPFVSSQRCILIFDQGNVDLEEITPHMMPTFYDWRAIVFASRDENSLDHAHLRDYMSKVSFLQGSQDIAAKKTITCCFTMDERNLGDNGKTSVDLFVDAARAACANRRQQRES